MSKPYIPPIAWDRFAVLMRALCQCHYDGVPISPQEASELLDAMYKLRAFYVAELEKSRPNKRPSAANLRRAAVAHQLVRFFDADPADAMVAAGGNPRSIERDSLVAQYHRLSKLLEGDRQFPTWEEIEAARARLPDR